MKRRLLILGALLLISQASAESLEQFLLKLEDTPTLKSARAGLNAAQGQVTATRGGFEATVSGGYGSTQVTGSFPAIPPSTTPTKVDQWNDTKSASVSLTFRPIPYGDLADALTRAQTVVRQAGNGLRITRANVQAQALLSFYQVQLSVQAVESNKTGLELAQKLFEVAKTQRSKEANTENDLKSAEQSFLEAQERLRSAQENLELARAGLKNLVGGATLEALPDLPIPTGKTAEEENAEIGLANAQLILGSAQRAVLPTLNASYTYNTTDNTSISASLETRTLQPKLTFGYSDPKQGLGSSGLTAVQSFQLGGLFSYTPSINEALFSANEQIRSAELTLEAAHNTAKLNRDTLQVRLDQAERALTKKSALELSRKKLSDSLERQKLGLVSPLVPLQAVTEVNGAEIALMTAQLERLSKVLDFYRSYGLAVREF
jgi:outer membrane protein